MALQPFRLEDLKFATAKQLRLLVQSWSDAARTIKVFGFTENAPFDFTHTTNSDRSLKQEYFNLDGIPLTAMAVAWTTPVRNGRCFVNMFLYAGGLRLFGLGSGYLSDGYQVSWPPAKHSPMGSGPGYLRSVAGTDPAAGAEISETVPTNARWRLRGLIVQFVTDATVANRYVTLTFDDGATPLQRIGANTAQAASTTQNYTGVCGGGVLGDTGNYSVLLPLPVNLMLFKGWRISTATLNLQAGDNFGAPQLLVEEWLEE